MDRRHTRNLYGIFVNNCVRSAHFERRGGNRPTPTAGVRRIKARSAGSVAALLEPAYDHIRR
ncbi:MAG: hypothetical protein ACREPY_15500, partial [Rhodanobacteraceae bacterium]